jgi:siderophore synthetase component
VNDGYLAGRVLDALLREDYGGLARHAHDDRLALPTGRTIGLRPGGFLTDRVIAEPVTLREVLATVEALADPRDDTAGFGRECHETLTALRLRQRHRITEPLDGRTRYETLAARVDHPVYPTAAGRRGLAEEDLLAFAPEFGPVFRLRWTAVPGARTHGDLPGWWPAARDLGLPADHTAFPVHPLTARLIGDTVPGPPIDVSPTLSMRTVAVDARTHLKMPLPTSTLGVRNRRLIQPGTLEDGALVQRVLAGILRREPGLAVLLADEQTHGHAGDPHLAYLVRRLPVDNGGVPVAALLAPTAGGRHVIEELTDDVEAFFADYLTVLFDWNVTLFVRYGIALEAHQQNLSVVAGPPLRILVKDGDGGLFLRSVSTTPARFTDRRLLTDDPEALARVFVTITVHLCAGAIAFGLAERGLLDLRTGLRLIRERLAAALDHHRDSGFLRARTLHAERLTTKAMVTAGTLVGKDRTGAADINKHYGPPGPNYLLREPTS